MKKSIDKRKHERPREGGSGRHIVPPGLGTRLRLLLVCVTIVPLYASCRKKSESPLPPDRPLHVTITLSTNRIHVGDTVICTATAYHPLDSRVVFPELQRDTRIIVRDQSRADKTVQKDRNVTRITYTVTSYIVGSHLVSTGQVICSLADGTTLQGFFPDKTLQVMSILPDQENVTFKALKKLADWPGTWPLWARTLLVILIIAILAGVAAFIVLICTDKKSKGEPRARPPLPHETALQALHNLRDQNWIETENVEPFYVKLSAITRRYLEEQFDLRAPEQTTEEFIREAAQSERLSLDHRQLVGHFLEQSDLVKFAKHHPRQSDMEAAYNAAERLILETKPTPEVPA